MPTARAVSLSAPSRVPALLMRLGALLLLWTVLVEAEPRGVLLGALVLPGVAWWSLAPWRPGAASVVPLELVRLLPHLTGLLVRGGLDVARHALSLRPLARPGRMEVRSRLPAGPARSFFLCVVSLGPGFLAVESEGDGLGLHLLDASPSQRMAALARVRDLEDRVARLFGLLPPPRGLS